MKTALWAVAVAIALAGCTDPAPHTGSLPLQEQESDLGTIWGLVVTDERNPLVNATVLILHYQVQVFTAENGSFQFLNVPPGKHVVEAHATGHESAVRTIDVKSGQTADLEFVLTPLPVQVAHYVVGSHKAKISYGVMDQTRSCEGCLWVIAFPPDPDFVLVEIFGEHRVSNPGQKDALGVSLRKSYQREGKQLNGSIFYDCLSGPVRDCNTLPLRQVFNRTQLLNVLPANEPAAGIGFRLTCDPTWVCFDETYEVYVTAFYYWAPAPVPPDHSGREAVLLACAPQGCLKDEPAKGGPAQVQRTSSGPIYVPQGSAQVLHLMQVSSAPTGSASDPWAWLALIALVAIGCIVWLSRRRRHSATIAKLLCQGQQAFQAKQSDKALRLARQVLKADPENAEAWLLSGSALLQKGKPERAIEEMERALKLLGPQMSGLAFILSIGYKHAGRPEAATQWLPMVARDDELWRSLAEELDIDRAFARTRKKPRQVAAALDPSYA